MPIRHVAEKRIPLNSSTKKRMRQITKEDIEFARKPGIWDLGNQVLYDLCRTHPGHRRDDEIVAKIWLIGRSYAASIERRKNAKEIGDDFYEKKVAPKVRDSEIDSWLDSIGKTEEPGSARTIEVHKSLTDLFHKITDLDKRSLASKYLHFHRPEVFFMYDSRVKQSITKVVPKLSQIPDIETNTYDPEYKDFARRCVWFRNHIRTSFGETLTLRELDTLLMKITNDEMRARTRHSSKR